MQLSQVFPKSKKGMDGWINTEPCWGGAHTVKSGGSKES